jgi:hypothetical protein
MVGGLSFAIFLLFQGFQMFCSCGARTQKGKFPAEDISHIVCTGTLTKTHWVCQWFRLWVHFFMISHPKTTCGINLGFKVKGTFSILDNHWTIWKKYERRVFVPRFMCLGKGVNEKPHRGKWKEGRVEEHFRMGASQEMLFSSPASTLLLSFFSVRFLINPFAPSWRAFSYGR